MSKRLLASKASKKARMLRPRSGRPSSLPPPGMGERDSQADLGSDRDSQADLQAGDRDSLNGAAAVEATSGERVTLPEGSKSAPDELDAGELVVPAPIEAKKELSAKKVDESVAEPKKLEAAETPTQKIVEPEPAPKKLEVNDLELKKIEKAAAEKLEAEKLEAEKLEAAELAKIEAAERKAAEQKAAELKAAELKAAELKAAEQKQQAQAQQHGGKKNKKNKHKGGPSSSPNQALSSSSSNLSSSSSNLSSSSSSHSKTGVMIEGEEDDHELSSHHFFQSSDSVPPLVDAHEPELEERPAPPTPESLAHRARLKKIVGGVLAAAALVAVIGVGKAAFSSKSADASQKTTQAAQAEADKKAADEKKAADDKKKADAEAKAIADKKAADEAKAATLAKAAAEAKAAEDAKTDDAKADDAKKDEKADDAKKDEKADDSKKDDGKKDEPKAASGDAKELKKKASIAINSGNNKLAIDAAQAAIAADPEDAMMYLYLGSAYLNLGDAKNAREAFNQCVRNAKTGPKYECIQMGGHK